MSEHQSRALKHHTVSRRAILTRAAVATLGTAALTGCRFLEPFSDIGDSLAENTCIGNHTSVRNACHSMVTEAGFEISIGTVHVSGASGVAPPGTPVRVALAEATVPDDVAEIIRPVGQPVLIELGDGLQPDVPIKITFDFSDVVLPSEVTDESPIVVMIQSDGLDYNALTEGTWNPENRKFTVDAEHLSLYIPIMPSIADFIGDFFSRLLGLSFGTPACAYRPLTTDAATYRIERLSDESVLPCLQKINGHIDVTVHSNTFLPWAVKSAPSVTGKVSGSFKDLGPGIAAIYEEFHKALGDQRVALMPGNAVTFRFSEAQPPSLIGLKLEPGLFLASTLLWQLQSIFGVFTWKDGLAAKVLKGFSSADCFLDAVNSQFEIVESQQFSGIVRSVLGCFGDFLRSSAKNIGGKLLEATAGVVLLLLGGAMSLVATGIVGAYRTLASSDEILFRIQSTAMVSTPVATATPEATTAPAEVGRFRLGQMVRTNEAAIWVYAGPGLSYESMWTSIVTHEGEVIGGPVHADGYTWWEIRTQILGDIWVQEEYLNPLD